MVLKKLTTLFVVDRIEACLPQWEGLGFSIVDRVPESGPAVFVILHGAAGNVMLQTRESLAEDLPDIAARRPGSLLYAEVASLAEARKALHGATVIIAERKTFYGATESWVELEGGIFLGLSQHAD